MTVSTKPVGVSGDIKPLMLPGNLQVSDCSEVETTMGLKFLKKPDGQDNYYRNNKDWSHNSVQRQTLSSKVKRKRMKKNTSQRYRHLTRVYKLDDKFKICFLSAFFMAFYELPMSINYQSMRVFGR